LISLWMQFWFATVVPKCLNSEYYLGSHAAPLFHM
jgi:hypothetical protein